MSPGRARAAARETAVSIVSHRSIACGAGERLLDRVRGLSDRQHPPRGALDDERRSVPKSPCLSRPPRMSSTEDGGNPSSDFAVASTLVPLESSTQRTPARLGDELGPVREAPRIRVSAARDRLRRHA